MLSGLHTQALSAIALLASVTIAQNSTALEPICYSQEIHAHGADISDGPDYEYRITRGYVCSANSNSQDCTVQVSPVELDLFNWIGPSNSSQSLNFTADEYERIWVGIREIFARDPETDRLIPGEDLISWRERIGVLVPGRPEVTTLVNGDAPPGEPVPGPSIGWFYFKPSYNCIQYTPEQCNPGFESLERVSMLACTPQRTTGQLVWKLTRVEEARAVTDTPTYLEQAAGNGSTTEPDAQRIRPVEQWAWPEVNRNDGVRHSGEVLAAVVAAGCVCILTLGLQ